jgi:hypothetical protein
LRQVIQKQACQSNAFGALLQTAAQARDGVGLAKASLERVSQPAKESAGVTVGRLQR